MSAVSRMIRCKVTHTTYISVQISLHYAFYNFSQEQPITSAHKEKLDISLALKSPISVQHYCHDYYKFL